MTKVCVRYLAAALFVLVTGCATSAIKDVSTEKKDGTPEIAEEQSSPDELRTERLFHIERSKNENIVCYDARITAGDKLDSDRPVEVYWMLHAEDGRREELNWIQKRKAYGFEVEPAPSGDGYEMTIVPMPDRKIKVKMVEGKVHAEADISGKTAVLKKVYIKSSAGITGPKVHHIKLFGRSVKEGKELVEKIVPE